MEERQFRIEPEFQNKIPPISEDEFKQLRENILEAGEVFEPLVVWDGVLVDGHNRWKVIQENPGIKYRVRTIGFADKWAAFDWMYKNQLGRRNLTDEQRTYMVGKMYEARKNSHGGDRGNQYTKVPNTQNGNLPNPKQGTAGQIARELGMGNNTVIRAEKFAKGVDVLREVNPEAADKVLNGEASLTKSDVQAIANMEPAQIQDAAQAIVEDKPVVTKEPKNNQNQGHQNQNQGHQNQGRNKESRELMKTIKEAIAAQTDHDSPSTYDIDDLLADIEVNGANYVRGLRNTIAYRTELLRDADAKIRVFKAIAAIIQDITAVRGEFTR